MKIAVLALQGAFIEHEKVLSELGAECIELRNAEDLQQDFDALVLPGGESTVQGKLLRESGMFEPLKERIEAGMPVLATCAGMILLATKMRGGVVLLIQEKNPVSPGGKQADCRRADAPAPTGNHSG